jgi:predicted DNA-binding protein with PD1-like motif
MRSKLIHDDDGQRTFAVIFDQGDEVTRGLTEVAKKHQMSAASLTAIGALESAVLGYFEWDRKDYRRIAVTEQVEVLSLLGNLVLQDGEPKLHAHVVIGKRDGSAMGGHLLEGRVRPTLEVIIVESPQHLRRRHDAASGLALISIE